MTKPPAGSSLLFGALADSGKIKQKKNGSYKMLLEGVDEIDWFTDRPDRLEGTWKPQKLSRLWDSYFVSSEPNGQAGFKADEEHEMVTFEMFKPKIKSGKMMFNIKPISDSNEDKLTGLQDIELSDISLFVDDAAAGVPSCFPNCFEADLRGMDMSGQNLFSNFVNADLRPRGKNVTNLSGADLSGANLYSAKLTGANLTGAKLYGANLYGALLSDAILTDVIWGNTTCPNGNTNSGTSPCTTEQLLPA